MIKNLKYFLLVIPVILLAVMAMIALYPDNKPMAKKDPASSFAAWWEGYNLICDSTTRRKEILYCMYQFYKSNPGEQPELEDNAFETCRKAANREYCKWLKK